MPQALGGALLVSGAVFIAANALCSTSLIETLILQYLMPDISDIKYHVKAIVAYPLITLLILLTDSYNALRLRIRFSACIFF